MFASLFKRHMILHSIRNANGTWITVTFIKKDGTIRTINGRTGVKRYLVNPEQGFPLSYFVLWSPVDGYRSIRYDSVLSISAVKSVTLF